MIASNKLMLASSMLAGVAVNRENNSMHCGHGRAADGQYGTVPGVPALTRGPISYTLKPFNKKSYVFRLGQHFLYFKAPMLGSISYFLCIVFGKGTKILVPIFCPCLGWVNISKQKVA